MPSRGTVAAFAARAFAIGAGFLLTVIVARALPVDEAGAFFLVYSLLAVAATFGRFGTDTLVLKLSGDAEGSPRELRHVVPLALLGSAVGGLVLTGALALGGVVPISPLTATAIALSTMAQALSVLAGALLRAEGRLVAGILAELGALPAAATILLAITWLVVPATLSAAVLLFALASLMTAAWSVPLALRNWRPTGEDPGLRVFVARHGRSLGAMMASAVLVFVVAWAPVFALSIAGRFADIALFTVAARLANFITLVPNVQVSALAPRFAAAFRAADLSEVNRLARSSARTATAIVAVPTVLVAVFAEPLLRLAYGDGLAGAAPTLLVLALAALATVALGQVNQLMLLGGLEATTFRLSLGVVAIWATAGLALAHAAGLLAIAALAGATSVAYFAASAALLARRGVRSTL